MIIRKQMISCLLLLIFSTKLFYAAVNTVVNTISVGITPGGMAVTPDNAYLYVANNNNYDTTLIVGSNADSVTVIDLATNTVLTTIYDDSFAQPYTITINPAGTKAYVTNSTTTTISIIDIATNTVTGTIADLNGPSGMVITPDGSTGYVINYGAGGSSGMGDTVSVVDLNSNAITDTITIGLAPAAIAINSAGTYVHVVCYNDGNVGTGFLKTIQVSSNTIVGATVNALSGPFAIVLTSDGAYAYVTNFGSNNFTPVGTTVSVIDLTARTITDTITLGIQPSGIAITPDGLLAYVSNYNTVYAVADFKDLTAGQGTVNIIDIATGDVQSPSIAVGQSPDFIVIPSNGLYAYVSNYISNTVSVIALQSFQITAQGCKTTNRFLTQVDLINKISWTVSGASLPVSYSIYRNAALTDLAGTVLATEPFVFLDHNRSVDVLYTYYIVGVNEVGTVSAPVSVTVSNNC